MFTKELSFRSAIVLTWSIMHTFKQITGDMTTYISDICLLTENRRNNEKTPHFNGIVYKLDYPIMNIT